jgi:glycosyltransferase involved in cell wall biosynthesis
MSGDSVNKKIKIFIDCRWYSQPGQGVVTYVSGLHRAAEKLMEASGRSCSEIEFWYGVESLGAIPEGLFLPSQRTILVGKRSFLWRLVCMPLFLKKHGFSVAHFNYVCPLYSVGVKYIITMHDVLFIRHRRFFPASYSVLRFLFFWISVRLADCVLTVSDQSKKDIQRCLKTGKEIVIVPNGPSSLVTSGETGLTSITGIKIKEYILSVGRVEPRKNYAFLVECFQRTSISQSGGVLVIVGFCAQEFQQELSHIKGKKGVLWIERATDSELRWLYMNAGGFIFPSFCEGFGIPVLEAMAMHLPVAVSATYPLTDILNAANLRFQPDNRADLINALEGLWKLRGERFEFKSIVENYNWGNSAGTYLNAVDMVLRSK